MKNNFNYKWSKIFASKRFKREDGFILLAPIEQHELLKDSESLVKKLTLTDVSQRSELLDFMEVLEKLPRVNIPYDMKMLAIRTYLKSNCG